MFGKIIEELNDLKIKGIIVDSKTGPVHIYFCMALVLGDNLALNTILEFQESFRANLFCRICKCPRPHTE